jgi:hypothetical protein
VGPSDPVLDFGSSLPSSAPIVNDPDPAVCSVGCWEYTFDVPARSAPVLVSVKSTATGAGGTFNADEGFDLYVYGPDQRLAGAANGIGANGQAVELSGPVEGSYTVVVTYTYA